MGALDFSDILSVDVPHLNAALATGDDQAHLSVIVNTCNGSFVFSLLICLDLVEFVLACVVLEYFLISRIK